MLFSSLTFLIIFLPVLLVIYYLIKEKYRNYILLFFSLIFYSWGEPKYILLMIISIIINYIMALLIDKFRKNSKSLLILTIIINIGLLIFFKYSNFFITTFNDLTNNNLKLLNIALPIGISFYTFQILSYVIDVYKKDVKVQKNILYLGTYISFFPQLIAGPIVRYQTIEKQLKKRNHTIEKFSNGLRRFIVGLSKKVIIANNVAIIADTIFNSKSVSRYSYYVIIIGMVSYTIQIYFDFSGYSDMAIGLGKMFGFDFDENFNYPYSSTSITEFWHRWHISLSTWFRDYVYIPLGGNKCKKIKWLRNFIIVWLLTGLWHGASWNYVIWGIYYAIILLIEKIFLNRVFDKTPKTMGWIYSMIVINIGWLIFRIEDLSLLKAIIFQGKEIGIRTFLADNFTIINQVPFLLLGFILSFPIVKKANEKLLKNNTYLIIRDIVIVGLFLLSIAFLINNSYNPFIYFRF